MSELPTLIIGDAGKTGGGRAGVFGKVARRPSEGLLDASAGIWEA
jgi:hypothetical protein